MSEIDTSAARAEWTAEMLEALSAYSGAQMIRALANERDAMRERAEKIKAERDALAKAVKRVQRIHQDMDDFDGDRRGHMAALNSAEEAAVRLANDALRNEGGDNE